MSYSDVTRIAGELSLESLQSLRKTNGSAKSQSARRAEADKSSLSGRDTVEIQRNAALPEAETYQRIRSPELAAGVIQDVSQQIQDKTTEAMLAQANFGPQTLIRLQR